MKDSKMTKYIKCRSQINFGYIWHFFVKHPVQISILESPELDIF